MCLLSVIVVYRWHFHSSGKIARISFMYFCFRLTFVMLLDIQNRWNPPLWPLGINKKLSGVFVPLQWQSLHIAYTHWVLHNIIIENGFIRIEPFLLQLVIYNHIIAFTIAMFARCLHAPLSCCCVILSISQLAQFWQTQDFPGDMLACIFSDFFSLLTKEFSFLSDFLLFAKCDALLQTCRSCV